MKFVVITPCRNTAPEIFINNRPCQFVGNVHGDFTQSRAELLQYDTDHAGIGVYVRPVIAFLVSVVFSALFAFATDNYFFSRKNTLSFISFLRLIKFDDLPFSLDFSFLCLFY